MRAWAWLLVAGLCGAGQRMAQAQEPPPAGERNPAVGRVGRIQELVLPAPELEVDPRPADDRVVLRIVRVSPHGEAFRYDFEYWAASAGPFDLRDWLRPKDGSALDRSRVGPIAFEVRSAQPPGALLPHASPPGAALGLGGYTALSIVLGGLWLAVLVALVCVRRRRSVAASEAQRPRSLAERLQPLVERAASGQLSRRETAELELSLVAYWRQRLGLDERSPAEALALLREHEQAGPLLLCLERWLHQPTPARAPDLAQLLAPYRDARASELDGLRPASPRTP